jgi:nucleoside deoxyribosyltransferase
MFKDAEHCYLAAPFFNDKQRDLVTYLEGLWTSAQPIYSPRNDGFVLKPNATTSEKTKVFEENIRAIISARFMLAVIDDFDPGVIWEMGFAYGQDIPILAYSDVPGRGLNVMLAGSSDYGFINGRDDIKTLFKLFRRFDVNVAVPKNTWAGEIQ